MSLSIYNKELPKFYFKSFPISKSNNKKRDRFFFSLISFIGLTSIIFAIWPMITWQLTTLPRLTAKIDNFPIPQEKVLSTQTILSKNIQIVQDPDGFSYFTTDFRPQDLPAGRQEFLPEEFFVTIPKLKIEKAKVKINSLRFDNSLSHFPGSALPGEVGNTFITGHSVIPKFYDPKNYKTIFSKLQDLEIGDDIYVEIENKKINFMVQYSKIVDPKDLSVLSPISPNGHNLTLMTCVPPGTNMKRLVVITSII